MIRTLKQLLFIGICCGAFLSANGQDNKFKIGFYNVQKSCITTSTGTTVDRCYSSALDPLGNETSPINVLTSNGANIIGCYMSEYESVWDIQDYAALSNDNGAQFFFSSFPSMAHIPEYFTSPTRYTGDGSVFYNSFDIPDNQSPYYKGLAFHNTSQIFSKVINSTSPSYNIWGIRLIDEPNYIHAKYYSNALSDVGDCTETPPDIVADVFNELDNTYSSSLAHVLLLANHGRAIVANTNDYEAYTGAGCLFVNHTGLPDQNDIFDISAGAHTGHWVERDFDPQDYCYLIDGKENRLLFEGSYHIADNVSAQSDYNRIYNNTNHFLGFLKSIDYMKNYTNHVHKVVDIGNHFGGDHLPANPQETNYNDYPKHFKKYHATKIENASWLWFQAYASIIHGAEGIWLYGLGWHGQLDGKTENQIKQGAFDQGNYSETDFPELYQDFTKHLTRELRYLKKGGYLSNNPSAVVATKTDEVDKHCVLPATSSYRGTFSSDFQHEGYALRYTIRAKPDDPTAVVMIITNPSPQEIIGVPIDLSNIAHPVFQNEAPHQTVKYRRLFNNDGGVTFSDYKTDRNSNISPTFDDVGVFSETDFVGAPIGNTMTLNFSPFDVHVIEFKRHSEVGVAFNQTWRTEYSNNGSGTLGHWQMAHYDERYFGNFDGSADGTEEMLIAQQGNGKNYMSLFKFDGTTDSWNTLWSNWGNSSHMMIPYKDNMFVCDSDNDGRDEIWGRGSGSSGWITEFYFDVNTSQFKWGWSTGQCSNSNSIILDTDEIIVGDFDGDGDDEILGVDQVNNHFALMNWDPNSGVCGDWTSIWSTTNPTFFTHPILSYVNADFSVAKLKSSSNELLMCVTPTQAVIFSYNTSSSTFDWMWDDSDGAFDGWSFPFDADDTYVFGDFDYAHNTTNDQRDELFIAGTSSTSTWAATMDLNYTGSSWEWSWNWPNPHAAAVGVGEWKIASSGLYPTYYYAAKLLPNEPDYLICFRKHCQDNGIISVLKASRGLYSNFKKEPTLVNQIPPDLGIKIFPNPANRVLIVDFPMENGSAKITSMEGKEYFNVIYLDQGENELNISALPAGIYLLEIQTSEGVNTQRFVKY